LVRVQDGARVRHGKGLTHAPGMTQYQVPLEVGALAGWNDDVLELADTRRDAVDRLGARRQEVDEGAAVGQGPLGRRGERHRLATPGDGLNGLEGERPAV